MSASTHPAAPACLHCGTPVPPGSALASFCCAGCEAVYGMLHAQGLARYYSLAGGEVAPVQELAPERSHAWLTPLLEQAEAGSSPVCTLELDVQGIHCAACVWLMNELFRRQQGGSALTVNPALGKARLAWRRGQLDVRAFMRSVESFGYLFGPSRKRPGEASLDLPLRLGVCAAITMNVMIFSVSFYLGLTPAESELFGLFTKLSLALSSLAVAVGGWPFFRSAWQGLKRGVLHLDLPIALGILLVYGTSLVQLRSGRGDLAYLDTLNTFITLMLVGRWLQQRVLERNQRVLLEDDGAEGLFVRRERGERLETVRAPEVREGDLLLVAPGDLVPVSAELLDGEGHFSTDWMTGEPDVHRFERGAEVPAGAFNAAQSAVHVRARTSFRDSPLVALLRQASVTPGEVPAHARFWDRLARSWATGVLAVAAVGLALWWPQGPERAVEVAVALLVVTCPCAIGLAVPLAYEMAQARLRRMGFFVRRGDLLDRLPRVRQLLFDKTGTLTLGRLELEERATVEQLAPEVRDVAYALAARSNHPVSRCLAEALSRSGARFTPGLPVVEWPGQGLELVRPGGTWRLGAPAWAAPEAQGTQGTVLSCNGAVVATFRTREAVRADARRELAALQAEGRQVWLLSGDAPARVAAMAGALGVPAEHALGALKPEQKAAEVVRIDRGDTLYLGDGVNDSLAFERALCAGTPAIHRPVMPGKADFFLLGEGLGPVRQALTVARRLQFVVRRNLVLALTYNVLTVSACLAGGMTPLRAAIAMPLSSLSLLLLTAHGMSARRAQPAAPSTRVSPREATA